MRFIEAKEKSGPCNLDAEARVDLTDELIRETGAQFGVDLKDAQDLLAMHKTMSRDTFAEWVNACGYLQIVQNALTKGTYEDRTSGLWKQALVRRCAECGCIECCDCCWVIFSIYNKRHIQQVECNSGMLC